MLTALLWVLLMMFVIISVMFMSKIIKMLIIKALIILVIKIFIIYIYFNMLKVTYKSVRAGQICSCFRLMLYIYYCMSL